MTNLIKYFAKHTIPNTLCFPPTSSHKKCSINIAEETFENKFFKETVVTTFAFNQSSSYITQNIIVHFITISEIALLGDNCHNYRYKVFRLISIVIMSS